MKLRKIFCLATILVCIASVPTKANTYPDCGYVYKIADLTSKELREDDYEVFIRMPNGNEFSFYSCDGDWCIGDLCAVIMEDNDTLLVEDDEITQVKYCGWVTVEQRKEWSE